MSRRLSVLVFVLCALHPLAAQEAVRQPVGDALYKVLAGFYDYDAKADLKAEITKNDTVVGTKVMSFRFDSTNSERVPGLLLVPPGEKKHPLVMVLHGYGQDKDMLRPAAPLLGPGGVSYAFLAIDAVLHGERKKDDESLLSRDLAKTQKALVQSVVDCRRALDWALARPDIDPERVAVVGLSMGAMLGTVLVALEPRIKTGVFGVGGADWVKLLRESQLDAVMKLRNAEPPPDWAAVRRLTDVVDPLHFAPRLGERPMLFVNALSDQVIPKACAQRLQEVAVGKPLVKEWFEGDHLLPQDALVQRLFTWLQERL
jgi:cephalosporin-C deacetylase-like acetyl esterase